MTASDIHGQLIKYLADAHSIEIQALAQLDKAPGIAGEPGLAAAFTDHLSETHEHERLVRTCLEERGADVSTLKDLSGRVGGWAMIAFARINPDTPGKLTAHAFSYEHMEVAAYGLLAGVARRADDAGVVEMARRIGAQERAMAERLAGCFDAAARASLAGKEGNELDDALVSYVRDAHAIEAQGVQLLSAGRSVAGCDALAEAFEQHLEQTREHQRLIEERLQAHGAHPRRLQTAGMRIGGLNVAAFFGVQPDPPVKLAGFAYAFEHLEIAAYELLLRVAQRAQDADTAAVAERILPEERGAAARLADTFEPAIDAALEAVGVAR